MQNGSVYAFTFRVEQLDTHAAHMFAKWLAKTLDHSKPSIRQVLVNERRTKLEGLDKAIAAGLLSADEMTAER